MSGMSPSSVLFSSDGYELAVSNNQSFTTERRALLVAGISTGTNKHLFNLTTNDGVLGTAPLTNKQLIQIAATVTASGSSDTSGLFNGAQEVTLVVNVGTVTGAGSIQYSIQQRDPGDGVTLYGPVASTAVINTGNTPGVFTATLSITSGSDVHIVWTVTGSFSATIYSTVITKTTPTTQTINGTVTATNNSVGADGSTALGFDTQVGGKVTTAAPTYTTGNLNALSLTTLGGLRIDGVYATGTANATAADAMVNGGYVTTAAPTYTTGQLNALSLTTAGDLRTVANQGTSPWVTSVTGTVTVTGTGGTFDNRSVGGDAATALAFDTQVGGKVTTAAPTYTTGNLDALSLTTLGGLRIDGVYAVGTANATAADVMNSGGYVTTAAPTYTTGQLNPLSLDTAGNLRVTGTGGTFNNQSVGTDAATALGFDTQVGGKVTTAAPTYTTGNLDALSLTTLGGLRIDGVYASGTANATAADLMANGAYVTTAAPTYTTGQLAALSLDTAGNLRTTAITNKATATSVTSVTVTANANNVLLTATASRVFASVYNNTNKTLYIKCGTTASTTSFTTQLFTGSYWEIPVDWTGEVDAFAPNGSSGSILVTELTP